MRTFTRRPEVVKKERRFVEESPEKISDWLDGNLFRLDKPEIFSSRGDEMNTSDRTWEGSDFRIDLVSAIPYRNAVGNLAIPLLYSEIVELGPESWFVDRSYFWETRRNFERMTKDNIPVFGHRSRHGLKDFDVLGFSCSYLQSVIHVGVMLKNSGILPYAADRSEEDPLV